MARVPSTTFVFEPVQLVRPCEVVAYRITEAIRAGDVKIGERLPSEQALSHQLGVSRPTLREAIKLLVAAGVVQVLPGSSGGIFVISEAIPPELAGFPLPEMALHDLDSVLAARRLFEPQVARLASERATPADFDRMREAVRQSREVSNASRDRVLASDAGQRMTVASTRFNIAVARATQNTTVVTMMEVLLRRLEPVRLLALQGLTDISQSTDSLEQSLRAIESRDVARIQSATLARINLLEQAWERARAQADASAASRSSRRSARAGAAPAPAR